MTLVLGVPAKAVERIPPAPERYFNDYARLVSAQTAAQLNQKLESFEKESSNQLLVVVYPKMESNSSIEDYTVRVAQSWRVGQKGKDNGAVLFLFMESHDVYIQVGYGLEGRITDLLAKRIVENEIIPRFRAGDFAGGLRAGVDSMIQATRGEYRGTGRTHARSTKASSGIGIIFLIAPVFLFVFLISRSLRSGSRGSRVYRSGPPGPGGWNFPGSGGFLGGFGNSSGSGGSSGGGGGFSGGGGSFGGGGAGGHW